MARGDSCISSRMSRVCLSMRTPASAWSMGRSLFGDNDPSKAAMSWGLSSKVMYAVSLKYARPNSFISHVFPTCRAPLTMSGFRRGDSFQRFISSMAWRFMASFQGDSRFCIGYFCKSPRFCIGEFWDSPRFYIGNGIPTSAAEKSTSFQIEKLSET